MTLSLAQTDATLLDVTCCVRLHTLLHVVACCCMLLRVVVQSFKPIKLLSQQLPLFLLFRDRRRVAQQVWIRFHSSSNIVGTTHAHYTWFTKYYGMYRPHHALQVPSLFGVVASVYIPLLTQTQQLPTFLAQQCWELLRLFARSFKPHAKFTLPCFFFCQVLRPALEHSPPFLSV